MANIFTYTCPNHSGVSAMDSPDPFEDGLHPNYIVEVPLKIFRYEISIVRPQKLAKSGLSVVLRLL